MIIIWMTLGLVATVAAVRAAVYYGTPRGDRANAHMLIAATLACVIIAFGLRTS